MKLSILLGAICCCFIAAVSPATAANLIQDPGFEALGYGQFVELLGDYSGYIPTVIGDPAPDYPHQYISISGTQSLYGAAASERLCGDYGSPAAYHSGTQALRVYIYAGPDHTPADPPVLLDPAASIMAMQDVAVAGATAYTASAWVRTYSTGAYSPIGCFGSNGLDKAGIKILELNAAGETLATHSSYLTDANSAYRQVLVNFVSNAATTKVRFTLDSYLSTEVDGGFISYDDLSLDGTPPPDPVEVSISQAKQLADQTAVRLLDVSVTAVNSGFYYVEERDRASAVRVQGSATLGDVVNITGTLTTVEGERAVGANQTTVIGRWRPQPLFMNGTALGGSANGLSGGVLNGVGLNNIAMLVKTTGKVLSSILEGGFRTLTINDGSKDNVVVTGVPAATLPNGTIVSVSGISSIRTDTAGAKRRIRMTGVELVNVNQGITVTSTAPVTGTGYPAGLTQVNYTSAIDNRSDWAYALPPASGTTWVVCTHGHGSHGDQLYTRADIKSKWLPSFLSYGLGILTPNLRDNAWMSPNAASDLHSLLNYVRQTYGATKFVFVGGSMGGSSNVIYAAVHPEDIAGVVALCPSTDLITYHPWCAAQTSNALLQEIANAIRTNYGGLPTVVQERFANHSGVLNAEKMMTMPMFVAHGSADTIIPVTGSRQLAEALAGNPDFKYLEIAGGDHEAPLIAPFDEAMEWVMSRVGP